MRENLSEEQHAEYEQHKYFHVTGGETGTRYRILYGRQINIRRLDAQGKVVEKLCFLPAGQLVEGDVMLAQKLALELQENVALKVANRFPPDEMYAPDMQHRYATYEAPRDNRRRWTDISPSWRV